MKNVKTIIIFGTLIFIIIIFFVLHSAYINVNFNYVYKSYSSEMADAVYPIWTLISTEEDLKKLKIDDRVNLNFDKYNFIACQGGTISKVKCNVYEYLFDDKIRAYVYVEKTNPYKIYIYKIRKINLIHDFMSAPTTVIKQE